MSQDTVVRISSAVLLGAVGFAVSTLIDGPVRSLVVIAAFTAVGWFGITSVNRQRLATAALVGGAVGTAIGLGIGALWVVIDERVGEPIPEGAEGPNSFILVFGLVGFIAGATTSRLRSRRQATEHGGREARRN